MGKEYILVSSGFVIPTNKLFTEVAKDTTYRESVLGKLNGTSKDIVLSETVDGGGVFSSPICNEAYLNYVGDTGCFDRYIKLVDIMTEVFVGSNFKEFIEIQAKNTFLSPLGFRLLKDMLTGDLRKTYTDYALSTSFFKIPSQNQVDSKELSNRRAILNDVFTYRNKFLLAEVIADLADDKNSFAAVFKYMLTDSNRGGSYG